MLSGGKHQFFKSLDYEGMWGQELGPRSCGRRGWQAVTPLPNSESDYLPPPPESGRGDRQERAAPLITALILQGWAGGWGTREGGEGLEWTLREGRVNADVEGGREGRVGKGLGRGRGAGDRFCPGNQGGL